LILSLLLTLVSGVALILFVLDASLLFVGVGRAMDEEFSFRASLEPFGRLVESGRRGMRPPFSLLISCVVLLLTFLFVPMGSLPQFAETNGDIFVVMMLFIVAQSLYIRGIKAFSGNAYQSLDRMVVYALSRYAAALFAFGSTMAWYILTRGIPGNAFSLSSLAATSMWEMTGPLGKLGVLSFFLLFVLESPSARHAELKYGVSDVPILEMFDAVRATISPAIAVTAMFSCNFGMKLGLFGAPMYAFDFFVFWVKIFLLQLFVFPAVLKLLKIFLDKVPIRKTDLSVALGAVGVVLCIADLYL
jgi:hypothetical protein